MADNTRQRKVKETESDNANAALLNEMRSLGAKMDNLQATLEEQMNIKFDTLNKRLETLIAESQAKIKQELETAAAKMRADLDTEVGILCARIENIESKLVNTRALNFEPSVSVVIVGLQQEENEDLMSKVLNVLREGLGCDPVPVR
ncbi:unnamed protein product [Knipowitschia caucasica]